MQRKAGLGCDLGRGSPPDRREIRGRHGDFVTAARLAADAGFDFGAALVGLVSLGAFRAA